LTLSLRGDPQVYFQVLSAIF